MAPEESQPKEQNERAEHVPLSSRSWDRRGFLAVTGGTSLAMLLAACGGNDTQATATTSTSPAKTTGGRPVSGVVNMLAWPGHGDKALIGPFEEATGVKIRVKEYANGDEMIALVAQSPPVRST